MSKFCSNCGNEVVDEAVICPKCGVSVSPKNQNVSPKSNNSNGMATAGFCTIILCTITRFNILNTRT